MTNNHTMVQYFEWNLPNDGFFWKRCAAQAGRLKEYGIDMAWLPPAYKGTFNGDTGYGAYDLYDLGEFDQKGTIRTKYGTKEEYIDAVLTLQQAGISVLADIVLNHKLGADACEEVLVTQDSDENRNTQISGTQKILAWTKFNFEGRHNTYSDFKWNYTHFSGTDWDDRGKKKGIFLFNGKTWNRKTDDEKGNYDYLMGADLDTDNPEVILETKRWAEWYYQTVHMDGFRLDAVKHISADFYKDWIATIRKKTGRELFMVGEYWHTQTKHLLNYLDEMENSLSLFDVPLHFNLLHASTQNGGFDMRGLFSDTLLSQRPDQAVTFVDNHDTQPGQALCSFIPEWFKQSAYAAILLRQDGLPCVFYGDLYGISASGVRPVENLKKLIKIRSLFAYGTQYDYMDHESIVGFTRTGDEAHKDSGLAVLLTDTIHGCKKMKVGTKWTGQKFYDALGHCTQPVMIDENGEGIFGVSDGSVSVWVSEPAYKLLEIEME